MPRSWCTGRGLLSCTWFQRHCSHSGRIPLQSGSSQMVCTHGEGDKTEPKGNCALLYSYKSVVGQALHEVHTFFKSFCTERASLRETEETQKLIYDAVQSRVPQMTLLTGSTLPTRHLQTQKPEERRMLQSIYLSSLENGCSRVLWGKPGCHHLY